MEIDLNSGKWLNEPKNYSVQSDRVIIETEPYTDFWQRSYYGFRNDNAPGFLLVNEENFSFTARVDFNYKSLFDQCGFLIYLDNENWFKASIEYQDKHYSRLGSVVTNMGYSDWATTDIELPESLWYRLNRRGPDFMIESSFDGLIFKQMRIFHLHKLGETTAEMGKAVYPLSADKSVNFGIYACSPLDSSFKADFSNFKLEPCIWLAHSAE